MANSSLIDSVRVFKDLDLNFTAHPILKDINKHVNEYAVINSVKNLVLTNFYERPFRPELGSNIRRMLFENVDNLNVGLSSENMGENPMPRNPKGSSGRLVRGGLVRT